MEKLICYQVLEMSSLYNTGIPKPVAIDNLIIFKFLNSQSLNNTEPFRLASKNTAQ